MERILCVYVTRQVDSNLMMASTVFRGLYEAGIEADIIFMGSSDAVDEFKNRYERLFHRTIYRIICSPLKNKCLYRTKPILYSYIRHFILDAIKIPGIHWLKDQNLTGYNKILSFIPPYISGAYAIKLKNKLMPNIPLIQFWTDPLSLGRLNSIDDIPKSRLIHKIIESRLLKNNMVDKIVFCYPLLCEMMKRLHSGASRKMTWSDVSFMPHRSINKMANKRPLIGFFGAYQKHVRNIEPLLNTIKELPDYDFIIRGDGDLPFDIHEIKNIDLKPGRIPLCEIETLEAKCDILLSLSGKSGLTHPAGKTFYYADYNKPIIHIGDGEHAEYFKNYLEGFDNRFRHCFNNKNEIQTAIVDTVNNLDKFKLKIPERQDAAVIVRKILVINPADDMLTKLNRGG